MIVGEFNNHIRFQVCNPQFSLCTYTFLCLHPLTLSLHCSRLPLALFSLSQPLPFIMSYILTPLGYGNQKCSRFWWLKFAQCPVRSMSHNYRQFSTHSHSPSDSLSLGRDERIHAYSTTISDKGWSNDVTQTLASAGYRVINPLLLPFNSRDNLPLLYLTPRIFLNLSPIYSKRVEWRSIIHLADVKIHRGWFVSRSSTSDVFFFFSFDFHWH